MLNACGERMLASQTLSRDVAKEIASIRATAENAYREVFSIHPILKRNASSIDSFEATLNEFAFLSSLDEKFKLLSISLENKISSFSSKLDNVCSELFHIKKTLEEEKKSFDFFKNEFKSLYEMYVLFRKKIENNVEDHKSVVAQKIEISRKEDERLRKDLEELFLAKEEEEKQRSKTLVSKVESAEDYSKTLLEEIRKFKVIVRVLENKFDTLRTKEKG